MYIYLNDKKVQLKGGFQVPGLLPPLQENYVERLNAYYNGKADIYHFKDHSGIHLKVNPDNPFKWFISVGRLETVNQYVTFNSLVYLMDILVSDGHVGNNTTVIKPAYTQDLAPDVFVISQDYEDHKIDVKQPRSKLREILDEIIHP